MESDSPSQDQGGLLDTNEQPSLNTTQVAVGEQVSDESAVCEVCEGCHHSKEDCPVVKAAQQEEEEEAKEAGWQVVATKVKPSKAKGNKSKKGKKGKKKGDATAVVSVRKDGTIIRYVVIILFCLAFAVCSLLLCCMCYGTRHAWQHCYKGLHPSSLPAHWLMT